VSFTPCPKPTRTLPAERRRIAQVSKQESRKLELLAERKCSELTRARARGRCEFCGRRGIETAHGFGKGAHPEIRFDGRNLTWACRACHSRGHAEPLWWTAQLIGILGQKQYDQLQLAAIFGTQPDPKDVLEAASRGRFVVERA
jgi:hypothetical protein